jgi:hypothetical protein
MIDVAADSALDTSERENKLYPGSLLAAATLKLERRSDQLYWKRAALHFTCPVRGLSAPKGLSSLFRTRSSPT